MAVSAPVVDPGDSRPHARARSPAIEVREVAAPCAARLSRPGPRRIAVDHPAPAHAVEVSPRSARPGSPRTSAKRSAALCIHLVAGDSRVFDWRCWDSEIYSLVFGCG